MVNKKYSRNKFVTLQKNRLLQPIFELIDLAYSLNASFQFTSFPRSCVGMQTEPDRSSVGIPTEDGGNENKLSLIIA